MKKHLFITLLALAISSSIFAETLVCEGVNGFRGDTNYGAGIYDEMILECTGKSSKEKFKVEVSGYGVALRISMLRKAILVCPFREGGEVYGEYYGFKADAAVIIGINAGIFYNKTQSCILTSAGINELGLALTGSKLTITASDEYNWERDWRKDPTF